MSQPFRLTGADWHEAQDKRARLKYAPMVRFDSLFLIVWMPVLEEGIVE